MMGSQQDYHDRIERAKAAFKPELRRGFNYTQQGADKMTHGIDVSYFDPINIRWDTPPEMEVAAATKWWGEQIQVHGDAALRDKVVIAMNSHDALVAALTQVRDRFFPADQPERDQDLLWKPVNDALKLAAPDRSADLDAANATAGEKL